MLAVRTSRGWFTTRTLRKFCVTGYGKEGHPKDDSIEWIESSDGGNPLLKLTLGQQSPRTFFGPSPASEQSTVNSGNVDRYICKLDRAGTPSCSSPITVKLTQFPLGTWIERSWEISPEGEILVGAVPPETFKADDVDLGKSKHPELSPQRFTLP